MKAFQLTLDNAVVFYQICKDLNLNTEKERVAVLEVMAKQGQVDRIWTTERSKDQFVSDLSKHFKVLKMDTKLPR